MKSHTATLQFENIATQSNTRTTMTQTPADWAALVGRIGLAALFLWAGYGKIAHLAGNIAYMKAYGIPMASFLIWPALLVELIGGLALLVGWKTRVAAAALALFTIPVTLIFHAYWAVPADQLMNTQIHFMKNVAILGGLLSVLAHGAGRIALDRR